MSSSALPTDTGLPGGEDFATTRWTLVLAAGDQGNPQADKALATLCQTYWMPLYVFVRRRGYAPAHAEDLVQGFFARLLQHRLLGKADRERGRFRTFLLSALGNFIANEWNRQHRLKRGGAALPVSWDARAAEDRYRQAEAETETPATAFDRHWAEALLARTLGQLRRQYAAIGKADLFDALEPCLSGESPATSYLELAAKLGMSEGTLRVAAHRLRRGFGEMLRGEVAHTVASPLEIDDELRYLCGLFLH